MGIHFEYFRRAHADLYMAHPLEQLSEEDLARLTKEAGMSIGELREHLTTLDIDMTCPCVVSRSRIL